MFLPLFTFSRAASASSYSTLNCTGSECDCLAEFLISVSWCCGVVVLWCCGELWFGRVCGCGCGGCVLRFTVLPADVPFMRIHQRISQAKFCLLTALLLRFSSVKRQS